MGDDERPDAPSLEAPSLGRLFGRRKERAGQPPHASAATPAVDVAGPSAPADWAPVEEPAPLPVVEPTSAFAPPLAPPLEPDATPAGPVARRPRLSIPGRVAAGAVGTVVGLLLVALTAGSLELCENVRSVSTCGGGPGFALLVAVTAAMVVLGGLALRLAKVPDPTATSFLAVGLLCVLALLFLVEVLDEWWMVIVIPVVSTATFLLSHWVTTTVVDADA